MVKLTRKLSQELSSPRSPDSQNLEQTYCAIEQKLSCCDGVGYRLSFRGAYTQASLCDCVSSCQTCFGRVRRMIDGVSCPFAKHRVRAASSIFSIWPAFRHATALPCSISSVTFLVMARKSARLLVNGFANLMLKSQRGFFGWPCRRRLKTFLLAAIGKTFANRGLTVRFVDFPTAPMN